MTFKRILMQAVDASPGGGTGTPPAQPSTPPAAAPAPAAQPAPPPAAPAQAAPTSLTPEQARAVENSVNAALRRAGVGTRPNETPSATPTPAGTPATPDIARLRALDRALASTGHATRLDEVAYQRLERDFVAESPTDARSWVDSYFKGFGFAPPAAAPAPPITPPTPAPNAPAPAPTPQPGNARPVSDGGGPPASGGHVEDIDLLSLSEADRKHLAQTKGNTWYTDTYLRQLRERGTKVRVR